MAPAVPLTPLSPSELAYLTTSLTLIPPIRPDSRQPTQFRPLVAELDILPSCNGSARMVWADGAECIAGIKAEVTRTEDVFGVPTETPDEEDAREEEEEEKEEGKDGEGGRSKGQGKMKWAVVNRRSWIEVGVDVQGLRDDDPLSVFLAGVVLEGMFVGCGEDRRVRGVTSRLKINDRYHWKLYIDILLITPPPTSPSLSTTHPLTLLSLTTHLALRSTRIPLPTSEENEDPLFNDDWSLATPLYPPDALLPPISLLVMTVGPNVLLDPSRDELCVAEGVWAISLLPPPRSPPQSSLPPSQSERGKEKGKGKRKGKGKGKEMWKGKGEDTKKEIRKQPKPRIVGIRTLESTPVPIEDKAVGARGDGGWEGGIVGGRGGVSSATVKKAVSVAVRVAGEVWEALEGVINAEGLRTESSGSGNNNNNNNNSSSSRIPGKGARREEE